MTSPPSFDERARVAVFQQFAETGAAPSPELARRLDTSPAALSAALRRLEAAHVLNLSPTGEIWKAGPFTGEVTQHRVVHATRSWHALCAWDAFGIAAMLAVEARVESVCGDCGEAIALEVGSRSAPRGEAVAHFAVPAARWYEDLAFT